MLSTRQLYWILSLFGIFSVGIPQSSHAATPAHATAPAAMPSVSPDLGNRIQAYFSDARKELGALEPWQLKLFNEEAVPEYQRFVRGYRLSSASPSGAAAASTFNADIDFESLRNFLRFYAPKSLKREKPAMIAVLKPQSNCSKCVSSLPEIKSLVASRLERRGFRVIWVSAADLGEASLTGTELVAAAKKSATQKDAVGTLVVYWQNSLEDEDAMHPDARHYTIHSALEIRDLSSAEEQLEVSDAGNFERSEGKLLADAFTELGAKLSDLEVSQSEIKREETLIDVVGIRTFAQYQTLKNAFQGVIKSGAVEEQKISRGHAVFAVFSNASIQKIQQAIAGAKAEGLSLAAPTIQANEIHLEVSVVEQSKPADAPAVPAEPVNKGDPEA